MINIVAGGSVWTPTRVLLVVIAWHCLFATSCGHLSPVQASNNVINNDSFDRLPVEEIEARLLGFELAKRVYEQEKADEEAAQYNGSSRLGLELNQSRQKSRALLQTLLNGAVDQLTTIGQSLTGTLAAKFDLINQISSSSLAQINCLGFLKADSDAKLVPKFYLFTDEQPEVPIEFDWFGSRANKFKCSGTNGSKSLHSERVTVFLTHGFIAGFRLMDSFINIKDRLLDMNRLTEEAAAANETTATGDQFQKHKFNVFVVDWSVGANPNIRANYIKSVANSRAIGRLLANFIHKLELECKVQPENVLLLSHSLGSYVSSFAGKHYKSQYGKTIGKMLHLDPPGLCFGTLYAQPNSRLSKQDAKLVHMVHTGRDIFKNPLDGALANFMVNGGRHQPGCNNDLSNSTRDAIYLALGRSGILAPCSHLRAVSLFEDDHYEPDQCQVVGYECLNYDKFLNGRCASCKNGGCKLLSFKPYLGKPSETHDNETSIASITTRRPETTTPKPTISDVVLVHSAIKETPNLDHQGLIVGSDQQQHQQAASRAGLIPSVQKEPDARTYYVGTSTTSTYCINYYQFRFVFDEANVESVGGDWPSNKELAFAVKLIDEKGKFFKGFSLRHKVAWKSKNRNLRSTKMPDNDHYGEHDNYSPTIIPRSQVDRNFKFGKRRPNAASQPRVCELTMLLNTTIPTPSRITKATISFYSTLMVKPQTMQLNYMSNISPR